MFASLANLSGQRWPWLLLSISAFSLVAAALVFQYQFDLEPCVKCIYQRVAVLGIGLSALLVACKPSSLSLRLLGFGGWFVAAIWGFVIARGHYLLQTSDNAFFMVCDTFPNFPEFMPLHEWLPSLFAAPGLCGDIDWQFLGWSMPAWMQVIFAIYITIGAVVLLSQLWFKRSF